MTYAAKELAALLTLVAASMTCGDCAAKPYRAVCRSHPASSQPCARHGQGPRPHSALQDISWPTDRFAGLSEVSVHAQNDLEFVRIRSKVHEIMVAPRAP